MNVHRLREDLQSKLDIPDPPHGLTLAGITEASEYFHSLLPVQKRGLVEYMIEESKTFKNTEDSKRILEIWIMLATINKEQELEPLQKVISRFAILWQDYYLEELCIKAREGVQKGSNKEDTPDQEPVR